jgi:hypothetical protein
MLENEGVELTDNNSMIDHVVQFYKKNILGKEPRNNIRLGGNFWETMDKVTSEENRLLEADFTEKEIVTSPMFKRVNCTLIIMIKHQIKSNSF